MNGAVPLARVALAGHRPTPGRLAALRRRLRPQTGARQAAQRGSFADW